MTDPAALPEERRDPAIAELTRVMREKIALQEEIARLRAAPQAPGVRVDDPRLKEATEFIANWFAPWGSWKTAWWEDVAEDRSYDPDRALKILHKILIPNHPAGGA